MVNIVGGNYKLCPGVRSSHFGRRQFAGVDVRSGKAVAIWFEDLKMRSPMLEEAKKSKRAATGDGSAVPNVYWTGSLLTYNIKVTDVIGPSVEELFKTQKCKFSIKTVLTLGEQMISAMEQLHDRNMIHRDVRPGVFSMGAGGKSGTETSRVYLSNLGYATEYRDPETQQHIPFRENKLVKDYVRYASLNMRLGMEESRRDDLEAIGYLLLHFLRGGSLPWDGKEGEDRQVRHERIVKAMTATPLEVIFEGFPVELVHYVKYCKSLGFDERPDYDYARSLFRDRLLYETCPGMAESLKHKVRKGLLRAYRAGELQEIRHKLDEIDNTVPLDEGPGDPRSRSKEETPGTDLSEQGVVSETFHPERSPISFPAETDVSSSDEDSSALPGSAVNS